MRKCLITIVSAACLLASYGCCKSNKSHEIEPIQNTANVDIESPQPVAGEYEAVTPDQPVITVEDEIIPPPSEPPAVNPGMGNYQIITLVVLTVLAGWLVYKLICRKK